MRYRIQSHGSCLIVLTLLLLALIATGCSTECERNAEKACAAAPTSEARDQCEKVAKMTCKAEKG